MSTGRDRIEPVSQHASNRSIARVAGCSLSLEYSFIAKIFLRGILPKQRKSEIAQLSN